MQGLDLILPPVLKLFYQIDSRLKMLTLFDELSERLGQEDTQKLLLKPILNLFEVRPSSPL